MADLTPGPAPRLRVENAYERCTPVLRLAGELDLLGVETARAALDAIPPTDDGIIFDVGEVTLIDSSGLSFLVAGRRRFGQARLRNPDSRVRGLVERTGLGPLFTIE